MILAHLGDLHLGYRAYGRLEQGQNARERDVSRAFQRAVQDLIRLEPAVVLVAGDVFDRPHPPPFALLTLARGVETLRASLSGVRVLVVAGRRDTPLSPADPGPVAALDAVAGVDAAAGTARSVHLEELGIHALLVPYRATVEEPLPELRPDPEARWNVLVVQGEPGESGPLVRTSDWDYVALAGGHSHRELAPGVHRAGSLERVSLRPWDEAAEEKGFVTWDLELRKARFHLVPGRPVVELAPTPVDAADPGSINQRIREVVEGIPGGVEDKVMRLGIEGLGPEDQRLLDARYLAGIRRKALHLHVEIRPRTSPSPPEFRQDPGWALERVKEILREGKEGDPGELEEASRKAERLLRDAGDAEPAPAASPQAPLLHVEGTDPVTGRVSLELPRGLLALMAEDHRVREALASLVARRMAPGSDDGGPMARLLRRGAGMDDPVAHLDAAARVAGSSPALDALEGALGSLREGVVRAGEEAEGTGSGGSRAPAGPEDELRRLAGRIRKLEEIPQELRSLETELRELRATAAEVGGDLEFRTMEWLRERQDAETQLQAYRDRARELKARFRQIESAGDDAPCPTCGRPLGDHRDRVVAELREEWEAVVQDGQWWKRRREQLEPKPEHLQELESRSVRLHASIEELAERLERARAGLDDVASLREREAELGRRMEEGRVEGEAAAGGSSRGRPLHEALWRAREELLARARKRVLMRAGDLVERVSGGFYGGIVETEGTLAFVQDGVPARILSRADRAMVRLALKVAGVAEAGEEVGEGSLLVLGSDLEALEDDEWVAAIWALRALTDRIGRIVVVSRPHRAEQVPEAFDVALEVYPRSLAEDGELGVRTVPVTPGKVRLERSAS